MIWKDRRNFLSLALLMAAIVSGFAVEQHQTSERIAFIVNAAAYFGTPYRYGGATAKGMDCSGFVSRSVLDVLDMKLPRSSASIAEYTKRITDAEIQPGDLLFFQAGRRISHTGIYIGAGKFIHSASDGPKTGVIISNIQEKYWKKTFRFAGSIFKSEEIFFAEAAVPFFSRTPENCPLHPAIAEKLTVVQ